MSAKPELLLNIGCGYCRMDGWINCDLHPTPATDMVFDVQTRWPFEDNQVREIYGSHMLEHVPDHNAFFREAWRVLEPNGGICLRVPYGGHKLAWSDPTHVKAWYAESFCFLQPGYGQAVGNVQEVEWATPFGIAYINLRLAAKFARPMRSRWTRQLLVRYLDNLTNVIEEMWVFLFALKTEEAVQEFLTTRAPNTAPARFAMYRHHYEGRSALRPNEAVALQTFDADYTARYGFDPIPT